MGNSPVDKGRDFIESGMRLITETSSDKLLGSLRSKEQDDESRKAKKEDS
jgi:hypothetical protein